MFLQLPGTPRKIRTPMHSPFSQLCQLFTAASSSAGGAGAAQRTTRASRMVRGVGKFGVRGLKVAAFEMGEIVDPGFPNPFLYRPDLKDPNKGEGLLARGLFSAY